MAFVRTAISTIGTLTNGSTNITLVANTTGIYVGMCLYGVGIQADTVVNSIAGSTITMSKNATASGSTTITGQYITQSGTDADPSGLAAMTGVTTIVEGTGTRLTARYNLGTNQLRITGTLNHNPDQYSIVSNVQLGIIFEGVAYNYGVEKLVNGRYSYSKACGLEFTYSGALASQFPFQIRNGNFVWRGGIIRIGGALSLSGGTFNQKGDTSVMYNNNSGTPIQIRTILAPANMIYEKIKLAGDNTVYFWTTQTYGTISASLENGAVQTPSGFSPTQTYTDFVFANNQAPADFYINQLSSATSTLSIIKNPDSVPRVTQLNNGAYGVVEIRESLAFNVTNSLNANASNVTAYVKDTDNGARTNENQLTYTSDFDYFGTGTGSLSLGDILVDVQMRNPASTNTVKHDYRGNFGTTSTDFNVYLGGYDYNNAVTKQSLIGNGGKNVGWTLFNDTNASLSRANAIAKLASSFTIDPVTKTITATANSTYDDLYDIAKAYKYNGTKANVLVPTISDLIISTSGANLMAYAGWNLVVNSGVTLSEGTKFTKIKFDTVTINGSITGIYETNSGTSTIWEFGSVAEPIIAGTSLAIYDASGVTKYYNAVTTDGVYRYYIAPQAVGETYTYAIEKYGTKREEGTFPSNAGGILFYVPSYGEDVGITETNLATVQGYTTLSTTSQIYDATANFRLSETGIKLGQLVARDGTFLDFGNYNVKIKDDASAIVSVASGIITYKSIVINESTKYNAMKATPPKTITPTDTEIINVLIEDANGDSQVTILGGDNEGYELWKITTATATDDYATGTLLATLPDNSLPFRFIGISGFDIVGRDISSGVRRRTSMLKGSYEQAFYVGNQIQLATDAPQLIENNEKLAEVILKLDTNLDAKVSTRLADADYVEPHNAEIDAIKAVTDTLENYDDTITQTKLDALQTSVDTKPTLSEIEGSTILAKKAQIDSVETKVDALPTLSEIEATTVLFKAADYVAPDNTKIAEIKTKVDTLNNTDLTGVEADLNVINKGVQKASLFIPHTTEL